MSSGGLPGFGSDWVIIPSYGIGVVTFAILTYADWGDMNGRVLDTLLTISAAPLRVLPPSAILMQRKNELLKVMDDWTAAKTSNIFAINFFMDYFPEKLKTELADAYKNAGKIKKIGDLTAINQMRGYFKIEGKNANFLVFFTLIMHYLLRVLHSLIKLRIRRNTLFNDLMNKSLDGRMLKLPFEDDDCYCDQQIEQRETAKTRPS
ncbi:hypothetical protein [Mucilaginibacter rubeus]|uniref:Uncharacterized protein n=1 Tax=Mucilaginibacter rubeus TaxID=2027860 RepID=A0A5C1HVY4_9SPHI|nr:hypothetical protein [Mucilaginibacter rubeus]QEM09984.1 hypothetical protein DEO27_008095 [Mucilaginibacter rubeus]